MLQRTKSLMGCSLHGVDGELGKTADLYFEDQNWKVRHLVVDTGHWLSRKRVLISPLAVSSFESFPNRIDLLLTRKQVEESPDVDTELTVTRQHEIELFRYYNWPYYWGGWMGAMPPATPSGMLMPPLAEPPEHKGNPHLQSIKEIKGYRIHATDGEFGHIEDFLIDIQNWELRYAVIDTRNFWPSKSVLLETDMIARVSWGKRDVQVPLTQAQIQSAPAFDPETSVTSEYEESLSRHYRLSGNWGLTRSQTVGLSSETSAEPRFQQNITPRRQTPMRQKAKNFESLIGKVQGLSERQLREHFKLYEGYVEMLAEIEERLQSAAPGSAHAVYGEISELLRRRPVAYNGVLLHELFFENLAASGQTPSQELRLAIEQGFGSLEAWESQLKAGLMSDLGWVLLCRSREDGTLRNVLIHEHHVGLLGEQDIVLAFDCWEHAYFIDYGVDKAQYFETLRNSINWNVATRRFEASELMGRAAAA